METVSPYDFDVMLADLDPSFGYLSSKQKSLKRKLALDWLSTVYPMSSQFKEFLSTQQDIDFYDLAYTLSPCSNDLMLTLVQQFINNDPLLTKICQKCDMELNGDWLSNINHCSFKKWILIAMSYENGEPLFTDKKNKTYRGSQLYLKSPMVREQVDAYKENFLSHNYIFDLLINPHKRVIVNQEISEKHKNNSLFNAMMNQSSETKLEKFETKWLKFNIFYVAILFELDDLLKICFLDKEINHMDNNQFCLCLALLTNNEKIINLFMDHLHLFDFDYCIKYWKINTQYS